MRVENVKSPEEHITEVLDRVRKDYMIKTYKVKDWDSPEDFLEKLAFKSGKLLKVIHKLVFNTKTTR